MLIQTESTEKHSLTSVELLYGPFDYTLWVVTVLIVYDMVLQWMLKLYMKFE